MPNFSSIQEAVLEINCDGRMDGITEGPEWYDSASETLFRDTITSAEA